MLHVVAVVNQLFRNADSREHALHVREADTHKKRITFRHSNDTFVGFFGRFVSYIMFVGFFSFGYNVPIILHILEYVPSENTTTPRVCIISREGTNRKKRILCRYPGPVVVSRVLAQLS